MYISEATESSLHPDMTVVGTTIFVVGVVVVCANPVRRIIREEIIMVCGASPVLSKLLFVVLKLQQRPVQYQSQACVQHSC